MDYRALINTARADMRDYASKVRDAGTEREKAHWTAQYQAAARHINSLQLLRDNTIHAA